MRDKRGRTYLNNMCVPFFSWGFPLGILRAVTSRSLPPLELLGVVFRLDGLGGGFDREDGDHVDLLAFDGLFDRVGSGEGCDLQLLVPELPLLVLDLLMELSGLMPELQLLLSQLQNVES